MRLVLPNKLSKPSIRANPTALDEEKTRNRIS
jgi:hypothetical protein